MVDRNERGVAWTPQIAATAPISTDIRADDMFM